MRRALVLFFLLGCKTQPVLSDAGLSQPPGSASAPASASASGSASAPAPGAECAADGECGPASCCGPFMAEGRCVKATSRNCEGVLCPQMVSDWVCACRHGVCATVRRDAPAK